jgi:TonB family protein
LTLIGLSGKVQPQASQKENYMKLTIAVACILLCAARVEAQSEGHALHVFVGKSVVINMQAPVTRVLSSNPDVIGTLANTPTQIVVEGKAPGQSSLTLWDDAGHSQILDVTVDLNLSHRMTGNAQTTTRIGLLGYVVTWQNNTCDEVLGAALTMPSVQQVDNPTDASFAFTVTFAGHETLVKLWRDVSSPKDHHDVCRMLFPYGKNNELILQEKAWVGSVCLQMGKTDCSPLNSTWVMDDGGNGGGVFRIGGGVSAPKAIFAPDPEYSEEARKAKYQGAVVLSLVVGADGVPRDIKVARSVGLGLDEKAIETVKTWKFEPGTKDGKPVATYATIEVAFHL